jgi:hypothetical protein
MKKYLFVFVLGAILLTSCRKPYQEPIYEEIGPNETAYLIPLEGGSLQDQTKLKSIDYFDKQKVVAKRVYIPTTWIQTDRQSWEGKWVPAAKLIKIDRTLVTREWTSESKTGSNSKDESIVVESKESIGFSINITITVFIPEESASKFLYFNSGKKLSDVLDQNIRSYVQTILTAEFGKLSLTECREKRSMVFDIMKEKTIKFCDDLGVKVTALGSAGGFTYLDEEIQKSINKKFVSEMSIQSSSNEVIAANNFARAKDAISSQKELEADLAIKYAIADALKKYKGDVPSTIVGNAGMFDFMMSTVAKGNVIGKK